MERMPSDGCGPSPPAMRWFPAAAPADSHSLSSPPVPSPRREITAGDFLLPPLELLTPLTTDLSSPGKGGGADKLVKLKLLSLSPHAPFLLLEFVSWGTDLGQT